MLTVMIAPAHGVSPPPCFAVLINASAGTVMVIIVIINYRSGGQVPIPDFKVTTILSCLLTLQSTHDIALSIILDIGTI